MTSRLASYYVKVLTKRGRISGNGWTITEGNNSEAQK